MSLFTQKEIDWNVCFDKVLEGLHTEPVWYRDESNLIGEIYLKEIYEKSDINFHDGVDRLVDLIAYLVDKNGFEIVEKECSHKDRVDWGTNICRDCGRLISTVVIEYCSHYNPDIDKDGLCDRCHRPVKKITE